LLIPKALLVNLEWNTIEQQSEILDHSGSFMKHTQEIMIMQQALSGIDWDDMRYFLAVARGGSLRGGAENIQANHATVSRRLASLEASIGARLFDRSNAGLVLTQLGEDLLPHAERVEEEITAASRSVAGRDTRPSGPIYFSLPPSMALSSVPDDLTAFSKAHPDIELHIQVTDSMVDLVRREADVTLRVAHEVTEDVVGRRLLRYAKAAYCSAEYAVRIEDNDGEGLHWTGWDEAEGEITAPWIKASAYPKAQLIHRIREGIMCLALARAGLGLTYLPCFMGDKEPGLVRAPYQKPVLDRSIWLLLHRDLRETARVRLFVDFLAARFTARKDEYLVGADEAG
jgi:DNA-binding transcriptional LysR family regulator